MGCNYCENDERLNDNDCCPKCDAQWAAETCNEEELPIVERENVSYYFVDDDGFFIRRLNGVAVRGRFLNGNFEEL